MKKTSLHQIDQNVLYKLLVLVINMYSLGSVHDVYQQQRHLSDRMLIWAFAGCICSKICCGLEFSVATNTDFKSDLNKRPF